MEPLGKLNAKHLIDGKTGNHSEMGWARMMAYEKEEDKQTNEYRNNNHEHIIPQNSAAVKRGGILVGGFDWWL